MKKRSTKYYRKNEEDVMKRLGLNPTPNSGAGEIWKEDGQSDHFICQLKSTDHQSISVKQSDIHTLEYNAAVSHKIPLFAIQFLNTDEVWVMVKESDIEIVKKLIQGEKEEKEIEKSVDIVPKEVYNVNMKQEIEARERFKKEREAERRNKEKEYKEKQRERVKDWRKSLSRKG